MPTSKESSVSLNNLVGFAGERNWYSTPNCAVSKASEATVMTLGIMDCKKKGCKPWDTTACLQSEV